MRNLFLSLILVAIPAMAMQGVIIPCEQGGKPVITGGISSSTQVMQSYPSCTITVYIDGGSTLATLYSNNSGTSLSNPFTANSLGFGQFYAANGRYDVQISGGGPPSLSSPYVFRDILLFDYATLTISPGGPSNSVQVNESGSFSGSSNLTWNSTTQNLSVTGISGTQAITVPVGSIFAAGGVSTAAVTTPGLQSTTDGVSVPGYLALPNAANTGGGYIDFRPVTQSPTSGQTCYDPWGNIVAQPTYLSSLGSFGAADTVLWNSTSPVQGYHAPWTTTGGINYYITGTPCAPPIPEPPGEPNGLNLNTYVFALGGFATDNAAWNAVQLFSGGVQAGLISAAHLYPPGTKLASGYTPIAGVRLDSAGKLNNQYGAYLGGYISTGYSDQNPGGPSGTCTSIAACDNPLNPNGPNAIVPGYASGAPVPGMMSFNTTLGCEVVYNGTTWVCLGSGGGGGGAVGPTGAVQLNGGSGSFTGSAALAYASNQLSVAGVIQSTGTPSGFNAPTGAEWNTIQAPSGGMYAHSFTALNYIQTGNYSTILASGPPLTTDDTFNAGALSFYAGPGACPVFYNGTTWQCFASSGTVSGGTATDVAFYTGSGASTTLGGNIYFNFTTPSSHPLLTVDSVSTSAAGMAVQHGYMQADSGFLATTGTCNVSTCLNAPTGGGTASSFIATKYLHMIQGSAPTPISGETTALGMLYFDSSGVLKYCSAASGTTCNTWTSLASGSAVAFGTITTGANNTATMTVASGGSLAPASATAGVVSANQINGTSLAGLSTGLLKNTNLTGIPSIATYGDVVSLFSGGSGCTGTNVLAANGTCVTPSGGGSYWTLSGSLLYPSGTAYRVSIGESSNAGAQLEVNGNITMIGNSTLTAYTTVNPTTTLAFQTQYFNGSTSAYNFSVDYLGNVTSAASASFFGGYEINGLTVISGTGNLLAISSNNIGTNSAPWFSEYVSTLYVGTTSTAGQIQLNAGLGPGIQIAKATGGADAIALFVGGSSTPSYRVDFAGDVTTQTLTVQGTLYTGGNTSDDGTGSALQQKVLTYSGAAGVFSGSVANYYDSSNRTANITTTYLYSKSGGTLPGGLYAACGYISGSQAGPPVYLYIVWEDELGLTYTQLLTVSVTAEPPWIIRLDGLHSPYIYTSNANGTTPFRVSLALVKLM